MLRIAGSTSHAVNGGGDIQLLGGPHPGPPWTIGMADPRRRGVPATTLTGTDMAVATSGAAERRLHIIDPKLSGRCRPYGRMCSCAATSSSAAWALASSVSP